MSARWNLDGGICSGKWLTKCPSQCPQLRRVVGRRLVGPRELQDPWDETPGRAREPEGLRLVEGVTVEGIAGRQPHAPVVPRRLRFRPLRQVEEDDARRLGGSQAQPRRPLDLLGHRPAQEIDEVHVARSTPGVKLTTRYGPAPTGAFLKPSSPTFST